MKRIVHLMCLVMGLLLASCGQRPTSGVVVEKKHIPAHNTVHYNPVLHMPQVQHIPERFIVYIGDSCHKAPFNVTQETYERLELGQFVAVKGFETRWQGK